MHVVMFDVEREEENNKRNLTYNMEYKVITSEKNSQDKNILDIN